MNERDIAALKADWTQFCDQNAKDDWAALAARIAAPAPKKSARRWIFATSLVAAAAAIMLVCLPILNAWRDVTADKNSSGDAPMSPDDGHYENMDGVFDASTTAPSRGEDINYGGEHGSDKNDGNGENGNANGGTPSSTVATTNPTIYYSESQAPTAPGFVSPNASGRPYGSSGEPQGGGSNYAAYKADRFSSAPNWLRDWVKNEHGVDIYEQARKEQEELKKNEGTWHRFYVTDKSRDIYNIVHKYEVPRAVFEQLNEEAVKRFEPGEWSYIYDHYTSQEIEDIYTLSRIEFIRKYAAYDAIVTSDGVIYSFEWIRTHSVEDWREKGFTLAELQNAFEWAKHYSIVPEEDDTPEYLYFGCYMNRDSISDSGLTAFEEKLIRFTAAEMDRTVYGDGYNTYISHARWNRIDDILMDYMVDTYGQEAVDAFKAQLDAEKNGKFYASRGDAINRWLAHFGITRATFEQLNEQLYLHYATTYGKDSFECWDNVFTTAEIDDIYALSLEEFNMKYAHPCTYVIGEYVYNFGWFLDKTWEDLWSYEVFKGRRLVALAELHAKYYPDKAEDYNAFKKEADRYNFESGGK